MSTILTLAELKSKVDILRAKSERATGAFDQILATLKKDWGCETIEVAQDKLKVMLKKADRLKKDYDSRLAEFQEEWKDELVAAGRLS